MRSESEIRERLKIVKYAMERARELATMSKHAGELHHHAVNGIAALAESTILDWVLGAEDPMLRTAGVEALKFEMEAKIARNN